MSNNFHFVQKTGTAIGEVLTPLAQLRIAVFRDYPYLYDGSLEYEASYLQTYLNSERAMLWAVYDGDSMVGATTCIPLTDETEAVKAPFLHAGYRIADIFYFGESVLLPAYRGLGLGSRFFDAREAYATAFHTYRFTCFCAVKRPVDHPLLPSGYRPLDPFWQKRGYQKMPDLISRFSWTDLGGARETEKEMVYWMRKIPSL